MAKVPLMFQPLVKYVDFQGRARRTEYWLFWLFQVLFYIGAEALLFATMPWANLRSNPEAIMGHMMRFMPLLNLVSLGLFIPNLAVGVRRLHDSNRTGWWLILPIVSAVAGLALWVVINIGTFMHLAKSGAGAPAGDTSGAMMTMIGSLFLCVYLPVIVSAFVLFVFNLLDGTPGNNRFGPDPKGRGDINVF